MTKRSQSFPRMIFLLLAITVISAMQQEPLPASTEEVAETSRVLVLPISDEGRYMVDQVQAEFILDALENVEERGYDRVVLKIDTFGGVVFSAREITERLLRLKIPTTAYIETKAISAGIFIAWACDEIVMEPMTTIGDAQMVYMSPEGEMKEAPEKNVSVYRSDWEKASNAKNRSFSLARTFFEVNLVLYRVGEEDNFEFMLKSDYELLPEDQRPPILEKLVDEGQLLTLHAEKAEALGLGTISEDFEQYLQSIGSSEEEADSVDMNMNQKILRYLGMNPWIFFIITLIGLNGIYAEIKAPGFGIPGLTALVCFTIVFGSRYLLGTAEAVEIFLFFIGLALCFIEIFVTPGVGVMGISGIALMLFSLVLASVPEMDGLPKTDFQWELLIKAGGLTMVTFLGSLVTMTIFFPMLFTTPLAQRHMLPNEMTPEEGYVVNTVADESELEGQEGVTPSGLRPAGTMKLNDGRLIDVVSDGQYVDSGQSIRIHRVEGNRIVVRPIPQNQISEA